MRMQVEEQRPSLAAPVPVVPAQVSLPPAAPLVLPQALAAQLATAPTAVSALSTSFASVPISAAALPHALLPSVARPVPVPDDEMVAASLVSTAVRHSRSHALRAPQPPAGYMRSIPRANPIPGIAPGAAPPMVDIGPAAVGGAAGAAGTGAATGAGATGAAAAAGGEANMGSPTDRADVALPSPSASGSRLAFTVQVVNYMKTWLRERMARNPGQGIPYVNDEEKAEIARNTGLTTRQISQWFQNRRKDYANSVRNGTNFLNHLMVADPNEKMPRHRGDADRI